MMRVQGFLDGVAFDVAVDGGRVSGSRRVSALVAAGIGQHVRLTPVGPVIEVAWEDPRSLIAWLQSDPDCTITTVTRLAEPAPVDIGVIR